MNAVFKVSLTLLLALAAGLQPAVASRAYGARGRSDPRAGSADSGRTLPGEFTATAVSRTTSATFRPVRTSPVQKGEFKVDLVVITFPDCETPDPQDVKNSLGSLGGSTSIADYFKDYSQGITWPVLDVYPVVYEAPKPLGYYCRYHVRNNLIGYKSGGDARAKQLREDALKFVMRKSRLSRKGAYTCFVYCKSLKNDPELRERLLRPSYPPKPTPDELASGKIDRLEIYAPKVHWADPLWPNSLPQVDYPADGGTLVHELGHVLGAPDFYHASEEHDGVEGSPSLPWSYGPTGMAYCRYIYNAFVPAAAYPKVSAPGDYTLSPRSSRFPMTGADSRPPLGLFVPSSHPNYIFCIEYCNDERPPVGNVSANGLLVHVINVTMTSPMMGPPDLCYTYRKGDADMKGLSNGNAYFTPGDRFDHESDPKAVLPNLLPAGIEITNIRFNEDKTCTFSLAMPKVAATSAELNYSLLPQTEMVSVGEATPTSFRARMNVRYRGEPLLTEYGFCYGLRKNPTERTGATFPLFHRDRYDARIIDLKPGATYYVRSYARSARGVRYGNDEMSITLPKDYAGGEPVALFGRSDGLFANWYYERWYFGEKGGFYVSSNPLLAFMSIANYYRVAPGAAPQARRSTSRQSSRSAAGPIDMARVHSNPAETRPSFRMAEVEKLRTAIESLLKDAGFLQGRFKTEEESDAKAQGRTSGRYGSSGSRRGAKAPKFGENAAWIGRCAKALGISNPEDVFVSCRTEAELLAQSAKIREWILRSQPVMVVRENDSMRDDESVIWPLDIAIIDGIGRNDGEFHVVYPNGFDRGDRSRVGGFVDLKEILYKTEDAVLMFYRPGDSTTKKR